MSLTSVSHREHSDLRLSCPAWCTATYHGAEHGQRHHQAVVAEVECADPEPPENPRRVTVELDRFDRDHRGVPAIRVGDLHHDDRMDWAGALELAYRLIEASALAQGTTPSLVLAEMLIAEGGAS